MLLLGGCVRAAEYRWWKMFLWQLVMLVEFFPFMFGEGFGTTFVFLCMLLLFDS